MRVTAVPPLPYTARLHQRTPEETDAFWSGTLLAREYSVQLAPALSWYSSDFNVTAVVAGSTLAMLGAAYAASDYIPGAAQFISGPSADMVERWWIMVGNAKEEAKLSEAQLGKMRQAVIGLALNEYKNSIRVALGTDLIAVFGDMMMDIGNAPSSLGAIGGLALGVTSLTQWMGIGIRSIVTSWMGTGIAERLYSTVDSGVAMWMGSTAKITDAMKTVYASYHSYATLYAIWNLAPLAIRLIVYLTPSDIMMRSFAWSLDDVAADWRRLGSPAGGMTRPTHGLVSRLLSQSKIRAVIQCGASISRELDRLDDMFARWDNVPAQQKLAIPLIVVLIGVFVPGVIPYVAAAATGTTMATIAGVMTTVSALRLFTRVAHRLASSFSFAIAKVTTGSTKPGLGTVGHNIPRPTNDVVLFSYADWPLTHNDPHDTFVRLVNGNVRAAMGVQPLLHYRFGPISAVDPAVRGELQPWYHGAGIIFSRAEQNKLRGRHPVELILRVTTTRAMGLPPGEQRHIVIMDFNANDASLLQATRAMRPTDYMQSMVVGAGAQPAGQTLVWGSPALRALIWGAMCKWALPQQGADTYAGILRDMWTHMCDIQHALVADREGKPRVYDYSGAGGPMTRIFVALVTNMPEGVPAPAPNVRFVPNGEPKYLIVDCRSATALWPTTTGRLSFNQVPIPAYHQALLTLSTFAAFIYHLSRELGAIPYFLPTPPAAERHTLVGLANYRGVTVNPAGLSEWQYTIIEAMVESKFVWGVNGLDEPLQTRDGNNIVAHQGRDVNTMTTPFLSNLPLFLPPQ